MDDHEYECFLKLLFLFFLIFFFIALPVLFGDDSSANELSEISANLASRPSIGLWTWTT